MPRTCTVRHSAFLGDKLALPVHLYKQEESRSGEMGSLGRCSTMAGDMADLFEQVRRERLVSLGNMLRDTIFKQVLAQCCKVMGKDVLMDAVSLNAIVKELVCLSEQEPYGVRGGTLVVLFNPAPTDRKAPTKIGRFPIDQGTISTFELHLNIQATTAVSGRLKSSLANLVRRMGGRQEQVIIDSKFVLTKKKLYRSASTSN